MRIIRAGYYDGEDEACFSEAIHPGSLVEESIEIFCAHTGAESLTPHTLISFLFSRIELYTFCFSVEIFSNLMRNL